jgi:putative transposase
MADFARRLLDVLGAYSEHTYAWCLLPNHYHALVFTRSLPELLAEMGKLHGRTSFDWNGEDNRRGRKVWFNCVETGIKSERHFWATLNYVHHNPVHHQYVTRWQDWPFSSVAIYLKEAGAEQAAKVWREYPISEYGKDWDAPDL